MLEKVAKYYKTKKRTMPVLYDRSNAGIFSKIVRLMLLTMLFFLSSECLNAQFSEQPISITTLVNPPYSRKLTQYYGIGSSLQLILVLQDLNVNSQAVKLQMTVKQDDKVLMRTKLNGGIPRIMVPKGSPYVVKLNELASYFRAENNEVYNISSGLLPEGYITFSFTAYDYNTGIELKNSTGSSAIYVTNLAPPQLSFPVNGSYVPAVVPSGSSTVTPIAAHISFNWLPPSIGGGIGSNFKTTFKLWKILPGLEDSWQIAVQNGGSGLLPVNTFDMVDLSKSGTYMPTNLSLMVGAKYVWQVIVTDPRNNYVFDNNGKSEPFMFTYGTEEDQQAASGILLNPVLDTVKYSALLNVVPISVTGSLPNIAAAVNGFVHYEFDYNRQGNDVHIQKTSDEPILVLTQLEPGITYEARVRSVFNGNNIPSLYSKPVTFRMPYFRDENSMCTMCDKNPPPVTRQSIAGVLSNGDIIRYNGTTLEITEITGSKGGSYSGKCNVYLPLAGNAKFKATFSELKIGPDAVGIIDAATSIKLIQ